MTVINVSSTSLVTYATLRVILVSNDNINAKDFNIVTQQKEYMIIFIYEVYTGKIYNNYISIFRHRFQLC